MSAAQHVAGCAVDQEQALNKTTEHQRAKSGKQQLNNVTQQVLVPLSSADLPNASQLDLSQLIQARAVWHQHRCTHWLWVIASTAAVYVSFFTVYHIGLGIFPGILGMVTAIWGLWWLCLQPEQQASNMQYFFKVHLARLDNRVFCYLHVNMFGRNEAVHVTLTMLLLFADAAWNGIYHSCLLCHAGTDNYYLRACLLQRGHQM